MVRTKKGEKAALELTPEEKLQNALVPVEERPYEIPENWVWTSIQNINQFKSESVNPNDYPDSIFELYSVPSSENNYPEIVSYLEIGSTKQRVEKEDVLLCKINPRINRVWKVSQYTKNTLVASSEWIVVRNHSIKADYLMYWFRTQCFRTFMLSNVSGVGGSLMRAQPKYVKNYPIPLPPLAEQSRIVSIIETLFSQLDEARAKAQAVVDGFEDRKAAILHRAFTGELTAKWREENGVDRESWNTKQLGSFSFITKLAGFEYTKFIAPNLGKKGIPLFKGKNVQKGKLVLEFEGYIPKSISDELPRSQLNRKCLLTPYVGSIGNIAIFDGSFKAHLGSNVGKIEINTDSFEEYILYYLRSDLGYGELSKQKKATAQESISIQAIREVLVPLPMIPEQKEIVRVLDDLLQNEQQVKETAEQVISQIDVIKKSILARAFRGELGTNDPTDERATELLKRVLE